MTVLCLLCLCVRLFICALWSPAGKGLPLGSHLWCLTVRLSIPDLCTLTYFEKKNNYTFYSQMCKVTLDLVAKQVYCVLLAVTP